MACNFAIKSVVRGYHEYRSVWENPVYGKKFSCARDIGNYDPMPVAIAKEIGCAIVTVSHMPRIISALCFLYGRGGVIQCIVNGH